jgi:hypothetical protein
LSAGSDESLLPLVSFRGSVYFAERGARRRSDRLVRERRERGASPVELEDFAFWEYSQSRRGSEDRPHRQVHTSMTAARNAKRAKIQDGIEVRKLQLHPRRGGSTFTWKPHANPVPITERPQ